MDGRDESYEGTRGHVHVRVWDEQGARHVVVLVHGYGEHAGRYDHVADALVARGAAVVAPDHQGHGRSEGERVLVTDFDEVVADVHTTVERARSAHPGLPVVMVGHSMGGMIAARYAQVHGDALAGLVLSGPVIGSWEAATSLLEAPEIPDTPIDVATLSRDPGVGEAYAADPLVWHGPFRRATLQALVRCLADIGSGPSLGDLPVLWVHGEEDALVPVGPSRDGVHRVAGGDLTERVYPGARHEVLNETNRDKVLGDVADFVDRVTGTGAGT